MPQERRPANLLYSVDENPPAGLNLMLSLQHLALGLMYMIYPVLLMQETGGTSAQTQGLVSNCILAVGLATLLQTLKRGPVGSGYLAVQIPNPIFLPLSMQAARIGGLALVAGMTLIAGLCQSFFSQAVLSLHRICYRLRGILCIRPGGPVPICCHKGYPPAGLPPPAFLSLEF